MALFKISKGLKNNLPSKMTDGYCYYTTDDSLFYIDYQDADGNLQRKPLCVEAITDDEIDAICGTSLASDLTELANLIGGDT